MGRRPFVVQTYRYYGQELEESFGVKREDILQKMAGVAAMSGKAVVLSDLLNLGARVDENLLEAGLKSSCADVFIYLDHACFLHPLVRKEWHDRTLLRAIAKNNVTMMLLSLQHGANPNSQFTRGGHRALALAVALRQPATFKCLFSHPVYMFHCGAFAAAVNYRNNRALMDLVSRLPFVDLRVAERYQITEEEEEELTSALIMAVIGMNKYAVKLLWRKGVNPFEENSRKLSAMKVAQSMENPEMAEFLADPSTLIDDEDM